MTVSRSWSGLILLGIGHLEFFPRPIVALKGTILVAFSASFVATVVDTLR